MGDEAVSTEATGSNADHEFAIAADKQEAGTIYVLKLTTTDKNAQITKNILKGEKGFKRNAVLMNAGAALYIGGKADSIKDGIKLAAEIIDSGKAMKTLEKFIEVSNRTEI